MGASTSVSLVGGSGLAAASGSWAVADPGGLSSLAAVGSGACSGSTVGSSAGTGGVATGSASTSIPNAFFAARDLAKNSARRGSSAPEEVFAWGLPVEG